MFVAENYANVKKLFGEQWQLFSEEVESFLDVVLRVLL